MHIIAANGHSSVLFDLYHIMTDALAAFMWEKQKNS